MCIIYACQSWECESVNSEKYSGIGYPWPCSGRLTDTVDDIYSGPSLPVVLTLVLLLFWPIVMTYVSDVGI